MHSGASVAVPVTSSNSSAEECASLAGFSALGSGFGGASVGAEPR
jgi:hypothetical protein